MLAPKPLVDGHCIILPIEHHSKGCTGMEENVWDEMSNFMKSVSRFDSESCDLMTLPSLIMFLLRMNYKKNCGTVFIETHMPNDEEKGRHSIVEAFPVPANDAANAPFYFKKYDLFLIATGSVVSFMPAAQSPERVRERVVAASQDY